MEEQGDFFRDLCDNAHDLIQSVTPDGRFMYVNRAWLETLGYTQDEVRGLNVFDVIHPDSRLHCRSVMQDLMQGGTPTYIEAEFLTKDGLRIPVEGSARCHFEGGVPVATRGIFRDVSRRKRVEAERDRLFNMSLDLLCVADVEGRFKQVNPAFERSLGYSREELTSRAFVEFVHPDDREKTIASTQALIRGEPVVDFENRYLAGDGTYRWLSWRAAPYTEEGLVYAVARDVTEQKRLEQIMLWQAEELARSNADLEQFASIASHDLRSPLQGIVSLSEWIEEDMPEGLPDKVRGHLHMLRGRAQRMATMIADLLKFARAGRGAHEVSRVDTGEVIRDLVFLMGPPEGFRVEAEGELPVLDATKGPLEQVFRNLINNAIKHHDRHEGTIRIGARDGGEFWEFSVSDDGPGIPPEYRDHVFKMFQQLRPRDEVEGTGIGLAMVKRIVEAQSGRVWVEPGEGRGACFRFTWPKHPRVPEGDHAENPDR